MESTGKLIDPAAGPCVWWPFAWLLAVACDLLDLLNQHVPPLFLYFLCLLCCSHAAFQCAYRLVGLASYRWVDMLCNSIFAPTQAMSYVRACALVLVQNLTQQFMQIYSRTEMALKLFTQSQHS